MYVTTFYSFKGGVGRTMALVNVAVELAQRGRRVLAVDFDLEAPGLDTFNTFRARKRRPGIVDFVAEYLDTGRAPEVERFVHESKGVGENGGGLHVMPSGEQHARYATIFREIDWFDLYERRDGYLLFEDLKAQWEQFVKPDYVLIDSRTGHTDTGGICTRQLPDAVVVLFFPNDQNLRGLSTTVQDIRSEARSPRNKQIHLHFVMSNVPDLDDEDRILGKKIEEFREELGFGGEPLILHRYDSLSLLNQVVFTKERPGSRLAKEYCVLVQEIVGRNLGDRDGALDYIRTAGERWRRRGGTHESPETLARKLKSIEKVHADDGEVLFALGTFMEEDRQQDRAGSLFHRAIEAGYSDPEMYLRLSRLRDSNGDRAGASEDAMRALQADNLPLPLIREAVRLVAPERSKDVPASKAVSSLDLDGCVWLAGELKRSPHEVRIAAGILEPVVDGTDFAAGDHVDAARSELASAYIGIGACGEAAALLGLGGREVGEMDIRDAFNYAMAAWGATGKTVAGPFARVVELDQEDPEGGREGPDPDYYQCMAIAYWATGDAGMATSFVQLARAAVGPVTREIWSGSLFSCWRYYQPSAKEFLEDLDEIDALFGGDASRKPRFMIARAEAPS